MPKRFLLLTLFIVHCSLFIFAPSVLAQTLESDSYKIRMGNFNMTAGTKTSSGYSLTDTVGQTAAGLFESSGYSVKAGFQYLYTLYDFSFEISDLSIDLGSLVPNTFATDSHTLTVSAPGQGYSVSAYETNRLKSGTDFIPDTGCNSGSCTQSTAGVWNDTGTFGFGYNASGHDITADFISTSYFRPFPDFSLGDSPEPLMSTTAAGQNRTATVTYQANVSGSQAAGDYTTTIVYIATPTY